MLSLGNAVIIKLAGRLARTICGRFLEALNRPEGVQGDGYGSHHAADRI
jgi:hypothetical protein